MRAPAAILILIPLLAACGGDAGAGKPLRGAPTLPKPTRAESIEFFYRLFTSGEQTDLGDKRVPTWQKIGEETLKGFGADALDYLLDPSRFATYMRSTNILGNIFRMLPKMPATARHEKLYPFLLYFLDPKNHPLRPEGGVDANTYRKTIFALFTHYPDARAVPACLDELDRKQRVRDLRPEAIIVLLKTGQADEVRKRYGRLAPVQRMFLMARLYEFADPKVAETYRVVAKSFTPELRAALEADRPFMRVYAAGALLRMGDKSMRDRLLSLHRELVSERLEDPAWFAVRILAQDQRDPEAYRLSLAQAADKRTSLAGEVARELLFRYWIDEAAVQKLLWSRIRATPPDKHIDLRLVAALLRVDREPVVGFLKSVILGDNPLWRADAIRFVRTNRTVPEAGAWLLQILKKTTDPKHRAFLFGILTTLRTKAALPVLRAEFEDASSPDLKTAAALALIEFDDAEGLREVGALLRSGDATLLDALVQRAGLQGPGGVPEALLPDLLTALKDLSGEESRLKVLFILRIRGRLEGVAEDLVEAYRRERSRRVVSQIETTLKELAHR